MCTAQPVVLLNTPGKLCVPPVWPTKPFRIQTTVTRAKTGSKRMAVLPFSVTIFVSHLMDMTVSWLVLYPFNRFVLHYIPCVFNGDAKFGGCINEVIGNNPVLSIPLGSNPI